MRQLEGSGVITRDGAGRYELTDWGRKLGTPVSELVRWAAPLMLAGQGTDAFRARWLALPLELMFGGIDPGRPSLQIEIRTAAEVLTVDVSRWQRPGAFGPAPSPDVVVTGPPELIIGLMSGALDTDAASGARACTFSVTSPRSTGCVETTGSIQSRRRAVATYE